MGCSRLTARILPRLICSEYRPHPRHNRLRDTLVDSQDVKALLCAQRRELFAKLTRLVAPPEGLPYRSGFAHHLRLQKRCNDLRVLRGRCVWPDWRVRTV